MPNGGVPINLEFWVEPLGLGDLICHQHARVLNVRRITLLEPLTAELLGSLEIQPEFLRVVVCWFLDQNVNESSATLGSSSPGLLARFESGSFTITLNGEPLLNLSGSVLQHVAAFMAYWVDHDAEVVPDVLRIEYPHETTDALDQQWRMYPSY
jgi:hypothetical protein